MMRDVDGVVVAASCWQVLSLSDSEIAEALTMMKSFKFAKDVFFLDLIVELDSSNVVLALNFHQQCSTYIILDLLFGIVLILIFLS